MKMKIEILTGIVLFFCFVLTGLFGTSMAFSSEDESEDANLRAALEAMVRDSSPGTREEDDKLKDDDLIDPQGSEAGNNTWYGNAAGTNVTGSHNSLFGQDAGGSSNLSGSGNTMLGSDAGDENTTGSRNTFVGQDAGTRNNSGSHNTYIGEDAGYAHNGDENTFVGQNAGGQGAASSGDKNTFLGAVSGYFNTGQFGTFAGYESGKDGTGSLNTFIGYRACLDSGSGLVNTFVGASLGDVTAKGTANTIIGATAGRTTIGDRNVFIGAFAGANETGSDRLYVGSGLGEPPLIYGEFDNDIIAINGSLGVGTQTVPTKFTVVKDGTTEATVFPNYSASFFNTGSAFFGFRNTTDNVEGLFGVGGGSGARFGLGSVTNTPIEFLINWDKAANPVVMLLNTNGSLQMRSGASCTAAGVWQNASSREYKENIKSISSSKAADALEQLNPVEFNYKVDSKEKHLGFIAEDVPDLVATKDRKGMSPMDVVAVLTKVVQDQQKMAQELKKTISVLSEEMAKLKKELRSKGSLTLAEVRFAE